MITVNIAKAREITKDRLRRERKPLLEALDIESMNNIESGRDNTATLVEKQRLRDITIIVDSVASLAALRSIRV